MFRLSGFGCIQIAAALILSFSFSSPSEAGYRKATACYEQMHVPAEYRLVREQVLVQAASHRIVEEPAVYAFQKRNVVVQPERISYRKVQPVYEIRNRKVQVRPASTGWEYRLRKGRKILCKIEHPAVYKTVQERVLVKPAGRVAVSHPAVYGTVQERVLVRPALRKKVHQPAIYKTVTRKVKVREASVIWRPIRVKGCH